MSLSCASIWFGGFLLVLAGILEFFLGNTFPFVVFMGYGAHFLTYGTTFIPFFNAVAAFTASGDGQTQTPPFLASFGQSYISLCLSFTHPLMLT
jgi:succinate-acetate transporter protein